MYVECLASHINQTTKFGSPFAPSESPAWTGVVEWLEVFINGTEEAMPFTPGQKTNALITPDSSTSQGQKLKSAQEIIAIYPQLQELVKKLPSGATLRNPSRLGLHSAENLKQKPATRTVAPVNPAEESVFLSILRDFKQLNIPMPSHIANAKTVPSSVRSRVAVLSEMEQALHRFTAKQERLQISPDKKKMLMDIVGRLQGLVDGLIARVKGASC